MTEPEPERREIFSPHARWPTTHWSSLIDTIREQPPAQAAEARELFCQLYQSPVYSFLRHLSPGLSQADAQDLTQEFFVRLLIKRRLRSARRTYRFRTFLMRGARWLLHNELRKRRREKLHVPIDGGTDAGTSRVELPDKNAGQKLFDLHWIRNLIELTKRELQAGYERKGEAGLFALLVDRLEEEETALPYAEMARTLNTTAGALRIALLRLRKQWGQSLLAKVAADLGLPGRVPPEEVLAELRRLIAGLED